MRRWTEDSGNQDNTAQCLMMPDEEDDYEDGLMMLDEGIKTTRLNV